MNSDQPIPRLFSGSVVGTLFAILLASVSGPSYAQVRLEIRPVETITLSTQQFLTGEKNGKAAMLAGELRIPKPGTDKFPAVVLVHGSGGIGPLFERWMQELKR